MVQRNLRTFQRRFQSNGIYLHGPYKECSSRLSENRQQGKNGTMHTGNATDDSSCKIQLWHKFHIAFQVKSHDFQTLSKDLGHLQVLHKPWNWQQHPFNSRFSSRFPLDPPSQSLAGQKLWGLVEWGFYILDVLTATQQPTMSKQWTKHKSTDPNNWPWFIHSLSTTGLLTEGALFYLRRLTNANNRLSRSY